MDIKTRHTIVRSLAKRYKRAARKEKGKMLDELVSLAGYNRKHAVVLLNGPPRKVKRARRKRVSRYAMILPILRKLWAISNFASGKRLVPAIPLYLDALKRHGELSVTDEERKLLLAISPATADRLLKHERRRYTLKGRARTKPGTLLKHQIPIRTFADWDDAKPGFLEIDTVHHCGDSAAGEYLHTLDTVDVATGWNECAAFMGRSQAYTLKALEEIEDRLPFPLRGIDFDTGGEFVNWHLIRYCKEKKITYTRAREGKKNDQPYIEQQNYSVVRRFVGYRRLGTWEQLEILNQLCEKLSDYQNFFQPMMKLKEKHRDGAKVTRRYDKAKTPCQRVLEHSDISDEVKTKLRKRFLKLNPKALLEEITELGRQLYA